MFSQWALLYIFYSNCAVITTILFLVAEFINCFPLSPIHFCSDHSEIKTFSSVWKGYDILLLHIGFLWWHNQRLYYGFTDIPARRANWKLCWHLLHCLLAVQLWDLTLKMLMSGRIFAEVRTSHVQKNFRNQPSCLWDGSLVDSAESLLGSAGCPWQCHCWRFILFSILRKCPAHVVTLLQSVHMNKLCLHFFWSSESVFRFKVRSSWSLCGSV